MDDLEKYFEEVEEGQYECEEHAVTFRDVLVNAIKMQAMYSNGKIKYIESSSVSN